ncbi:MAG: amidohydrolase family protein, partial [Hungatella sp.]
MILAAKTIVTGDGKTVLTDSAVLVQNGKILEIGNAEEMKKNHPDETVKDYGDATILPGLIDMHIHLGGSWRHRPDAMYFDDHLISYFALAAAQNAFGVGVTTLRDVGSEHLLCEKMRYAGKQGFVEIPRLIHTD